ncbi:MAG TPA: hypothetical protein VFF26_09105 [Gallionella sp.]|nr:hypothetical protein [Gallionella sp.]
MLKRLLRSSAQRERNGASLMRESQRIRIVAARGKFHRPNRYRDGFVELAEPAMRHRQPQHRLTEQIRAP